jgi:hypothetical protein
MPETVTATGSLMKSASGHLTVKKEGKNKEIPAHVLNGAQGAMLFNALAPRVFTADLSLKYKQGILPLWRGIFRKWIPKQLNKSEGRNRVRQKRYTT